MHKTFQIRGKKYRIDIDKAGAPLVFVAWLAAWGIFLRVMLDAMMGW